MILQVSLSQVLHIQMPTDPAMKARAIITITDFTFLSFFSHVVPRFYKCVAEAQHHRGLVWSTVVWCSVIQRARQLFGGSLIPPQPF